jgi:ParB family chromosome partitioning protein
MAKLGMLKNVREQAGTNDSRSVTLTVRDIPIGDIAVKENVRGEYTGLDELAASIRQHGLLQPITVYADGEGYAVKTGHRRYMACAALYREEPERFHRIRCVVSDAHNVAVIQLVENVQRENLSQTDLFNALSALREQGMTLKQIADVMGKTEKYVKNLFVGINEISDDEELQSFIDSPASGTIQDIADTKSVSNRQDRLNLLEQRKNGAINRTELREKVRKFKTPQPVTEAPKKIALSVRVFTNLNEIIIRAVNDDDKKRLTAAGKELQRCIAQSDTFCLAENPAQTKPQGGKNAKQRKR